ncbi:hypothetical protein L227DRAFT_88324 [Lentinus tigrinus ALCF2SS1-6]|uniref:Secreted protein n=1 Tax=Lentinus tigrinus ALCF2SS1-6 TaxID=1328759 RepID=A0A5C2S9X6_9APHY|nr:hypothetical protein L227DRAFT_88324 [Lentinus tigrinus ALCF2SS1-6]
MSSLIIVLLTQSCVGDAIIIGAWPRRSHLSQRRDSPQSEVLHASLCTHAVGLHIELVRNFRRCGLCEVDSKK